MSVVVVGGGVIGYAVAFELAARGAAVHLIEMRGPGRGATHASAGMLAPYIEGHEERLRMLGARSLSVYDRFVHDLDVVAGDRTEYERCGTLEVAYTPSHERAVLASATLLTGFGVDHVLLSPRDVEAAEPALAPGAAVALSIPTHGYVHVGALVSNLCTAASRLGVVVSTGRVTGVESLAQGRVGVVTDDGYVEASAVVVANGSWASLLRLRNVPLVPVTPIRGQSIELAYDRSPVSRIVWGEDCYLVPRRDGSLLVGATVEDVGFDEASTPEGVETLLVRSQALLSSVRSVPVREVRAGLRPRTADQLPLVGWLASHPRVCLATGHYRNGILLAPLTATLVAGLVLDADDADLRWAREALAPARVGL